MPFYSAHYAGNTHLLWEENRGIKLYPKVFSRLFDYVHSNVVNNEWSVVNGQTLSVNGEMSNVKLATGLNYWLFSHVIFQPPTDRTIFNSLPSITCNLKPIAYSTVTLFAKVTWFVYIKAFGYTDVISQ